MLLEKVNNIICNKLFFGKLATTGRNNTGRITIRHRGGSQVSRLYRLVDFNRYIWNVKALVLSFDYDPNRSSLLTLLSYSNSVFSFVLATQGSIVANVIINTNTELNYETRNGYCANLNFIRPGLYINNLELKPLSGASLIRAGSMYGKLVSNSKNGFSIIKLRSKVLLKISKFCVATVGVLLSKKTEIFRSIRNAGYNRNLGWRPSVRGVAMNPIDHPHGGGQGKTSGGRISVTPWGLITKGKKTRRKISYGSFVLKR